MRSPARPPSPAEARKLFGRPPVFIAWDDCVWWYERGGQRQPGLSIMHDGTVAEPQPSNGGAWTVMDDLELGVYLAAEDAAPGTLHAWRETLRRWQDLPSATLRAVDGVYLHPPGIAGECLRLARANLASLEASQIVPRWTA